MGLLGADHGGKDVGVQHFAQLQHRHRDKEHEGDAKDPVEEEAADKVLSGEANAVLPPCVEGLQRGRVQEHSEEQRQEEHLEEEEDAHLTDTAGQRRRQAAERRCP